MAIHHFTLIVDGPDVQEEALIEALFEAGCDDGLVGRSEGVQYIEFDREAPDLEVAYAIGGGRCGEGSQA